MDNEEKSALVFFFVGLAITGVVVMVVLGLVWSRSTVTMSGPAVPKSVSEVATTTMPTEWKTYSNREAGYSFVYPSVFELKEGNGKVEISHNINFENHGTCDMKGDEETYPTLEDVNISIEVKKMNVAKAAKQVSPYLPAENFTKDSLKVSSGFIDEYSVGNLKGFAIYEGAEGCGQMTYYFPLSATSTLVAQKRIPQQLSGVLSSNIEQEILATPGAISRQESDKIFQQILTSFIILTDQTLWKTYKNEEYGFEFKYPADWKVSKVELGVCLNPIGAPLGLEGSEVDCAVKIFQDRDKTNIDNLYNDLKPTWGGVYMEVDGYRSILLSSYMGQMVYVQKGQEVYFIGSPFPDENITEFIKSIAGNLKFTK